MNSEDAGGAIKVLLVDDVPDIRLLLRVGLQSDGRFSIVGEAEDGEQAVALARHLRPDVIVLDLAMPVMDGFEAIPEIHRVAPDSRVLAYSGHHTDKASKAIELCAYAFAAKGTPVRELADLIVRVHGSSEKPC